MSKDEGGDVPPAGRVRFIEFGVPIANGAVSNHSCAFNHVNCRVGWLAPRSKTSLCDFAVREHIQERRLPQSDVERRLERVMRS